MRGGAAQSSGIPVQISAHILHRMGRAGNGTRIRFGHLRSVADVAATDLVSTLEAAVTLHALALLFGAPRAGKPKANPRPGVGISVMVDVQKPDHGRRTSAFRLRASGSAGVAHAC
jgi:hypothetical protein